MTKNISIEQGSYKKYFLILYQFKIGNQCISEFIPEVLDARILV